MGVPGWKPMESDGWKDGRRVLLLVGEELVSARFRQTAPVWECFDGKFYLDIKEDPQKETWDHGEVRAWQDIPDRISSENPYLSR